MNSICRFIPVKQNNDTLKVVHFVYEAEFHKIKQPFLNPIYYLHLVTRGEGVLYLQNKTYNLRVGTLFFGLPGVSYEIKGSEDFSYMYLSYMGTRSLSLAKELGISLARPVYYGFEEMIHFWSLCIQRVEPSNANILSESVLLFTLSYLNKDGGCVIKTKSSTILESITDYVDHNYQNPDLSLKQVAGIFSYTDKYLSHLFKENMHVNWSGYLNQLRIQHALDLMEKGWTDIGEIAIDSGYRDAMYFSKVFKRKMAVSPRAYLKKKKQ